MGRPKQFDPDAAVEKAVEIFWCKGYGGTTPQDLVDGLGVGKGSLYNTFTSKQALFEKALRRYGDRRVAGLVEVLEGSGPVRERLRAALERLVDTGLSDPYRRGCLAVNTAAEPAGADPALGEIVRSVFDRMEAAFQAAIEEGRRHGEIDADRDPREAASLLLSTAIGMSVVAKTADRPDRLRRVVDAVLATL
ncbi:TetR/AcrR family transcriptional regulator [Sphaerisporangium perillae]|uniref:TetR/AcrR family transcriptional regulator n=1 Tax=Sphaerisporangium perillae TaxID=2935860 RepID=UPI00200D64FF|nr:TetR/AcrR family transcriptional regulator [Sphaerisporangium perillae]